jgi:glycosidase
MFNQFLENILKDHPLFGVEREDQQKGHLIGLEAPAWVQDGPLYEIFVRNFSLKGTFKSLQDKIPYLLDLGIKTIWLMPIYPIGNEDRKGTLGSPYAIRDYSEIDPTLGTPDDLKTLIKTIHEAGMRVILDLVANHMAVDSIWRNDYPEYFLKNDRGDITRKISEWSDVIDLDYTNQELQARMRKVICTWVERFDLDGFRCDVAGLVPTDFWEMVYNSLIKIKDDIFLLAEWESTNMHPSAFHATYDWSTHFVLQDIYEGKRPAKDAVTWVNEKKANYPRNALPMRFTENHDFVRTRDKFGTDSFYPFVVFNYLIYGIPLIYCGQEFGLKKIPNLFDKDPIDWDQFDGRIFGFYKKLISLRKKYPAFSSRKLKNIGNDKPDQIVSILKSNNESKILAILNFSQEKLDVKIDIADSYHSDQKIVDLYSGKKIEISELSDFRIDPFGYYLLKPV